MSASSKKYVKIALVVILLWFLIAVLWLTIGGIHSEPAHAATQRHFIKGPITAKKFISNVKPAPLLTLQHKSPVVTMARRVWGPYPWTCMGGKWGTKYYDVTGVRLVTAWRHFNWCRTRDHRKLYNVQKGGIVVEGSWLSTVSSVRWKAQTAKSGHFWRHSIPPLRPKRHYIDWVRVHGEQCIPVLRAILCKGYTKWDDVDISPSNIITVFQSKP